MIRKGHYEHIHIMLSIYWDHEDYSFNQSFSVNTLSQLHLVCSGLWTYVYIYICLYLCMRIYIYACICLFCIISPSCTDKLQLSRDFNIYTYGHFLENDMETGPKNGQNQFLVPKEREAKTIDFFKFFHLTKFVF